MILVSAGHHPSAKGASWGGFYEYPETLHWANEIVSFLGSLGELVPTGNLRSKVEYINNHPDAEAAIEVHFNQTPNGLPSSRPKWAGAATLYCPGSEQGKLLAESVQAQVEPLFGKHWHGAMEGWYQMDRKNGPDYFLKETHCPAIIAEPEFIFRKELLQQSRTDACRAIALGILKAVDND